MQQFMFGRNELEVDFLKEKLLDGFDVRVAMEPDPAREGNRPHYWETLELPYVIAGDDYFWAMSQARHYAGTHDEMKQGYKTPPNLFAYCRPWDLFASHAIGKEDVYIMHKSLYRSFKWKLSQRWVPVWDSKKNAEDDCDGVAEAIRTFSSMKAAVSFDGFTFSVPVDIPSYHPQSGTCHFKTASMEFPALFLSSEGMNSIETMIYGETTDIPERNHSYVHSCSVNDIFLYLSTKGTLYSLLKPGVRMYDRLVILGERQMLAPENPRWEDSCSFRIGDPAADN